MESGLALMRAHYQHVPHCRLLARHLNRSLDRLLQAAFRIPPRRKLSEVDRDDHTPRVIGMIKAE